jgi:RimJ/RimL family protein N-acetyltransferase
MSPRELEPLPDIRLSDGIVTIRPFILEDAQAHLAGEDEEQVKWLSGGKSTLESVQKWIEENTGSWRRGGGPLYNFAVEDAETRKLIGMVEASTDTSIAGIKEGDANISYALYPDARGKGYVTKAVTLLLDFLKSRGIKRAVIRVDLKNTASANVPARLGFTKIEGIIQTEEGHSLSMFIKELE